MRAGAAKVVEQRVEERSVGVLVAGVGDEAGRLGNREEVVVLEENLHAYSPLPLKWSSSSAKRTLKLVSEP